MPDVQFPRTGESLLFLHFSLGIGSKWAQESISAAARPRRGTEMYFRNFLLRALPAEDATYLTPHLREVSLSRAQPLYEPGDAVDTLYFASSACISVVSVMRDGRIVETTTVGRESAPGLLYAVTDLPATSRIFVQVAGGALALPSAVYRKRLAESPGLVNLTL